MFRSAALTAFAFAAAIPASAAPAPAYLRCNNHYVYLNESDKVDTMVPGYRATMGIFSFSVIAPGQAKKMKTVPVQYSYGVSYYPEMRNVALAGPVRTQMQGFNRFASGTLKPVIGND